MDIFEIYANIDSISEYMCAIPRLFVSMCRDVCNIFQQVVDNQRKNHIISRFLKFIYTNRVHVFSPEIRGTGMAINFYKTAYRFRREVGEIDSEYADEILAASNLIINFFEMNSHIFTLPQMEEEEESGDSGEESDGSERDLDNDVIMQ